MFPLLRSGVRGGEQLWTTPPVDKLSTEGQSYPQVVDTLNHTVDSIRYLVIQGPIHRLHRTYCYYSF